MTMTRFLNLTYLFVISAVILCCSGKKEGDDAGHHHEAEEAGSVSDGNDWKEMDDFHVIMAETFHPFKDSANLEPVKIHSEHLAMEAEKWAGSTMPEKVNNDDVKAKLDRLKAETRTLVDKIKEGAPDEAIGTQLTTVHNTFHEIQESWYGGDKDQGDHH